MSHLVAESNQSQGDIFVMLIYINAQCWRLCREIYSLVSPVVRFFRYRFQTCPTAAAILHPVACLWVSRQERGTAAGLEAYHPAPASEVRGRTPLSQHMEMKEQYVDRLDGYISESPKSKKKRSLIPFFLLGAVIVFGGFLWATMQLGGL